MTLIEDSQEGQLDRAHLPMSRYTSTNSCADRLITEGSRDSASRLMRSDPHLPARFFKMPQVRTIQARLCSDPACS